VLIHARSSCCLTVLQPGSCAFTKIRSCDVDAVETIFVLQATFCVYAYWKFRCSTYCYVNPHNYFGVIKNNRTWGNDFECHKMVCNVVEWWWRFDLNSLMFAVGAVSVIYSIEIVWSSAVNEPITGHCDVSSTNLVSVLCRTSDLNELQMRVMWQLWFGYKNACISGQKAQYM
jgi:hypothetical protein